MADTAKDKLQELWNGIKDVVGDLTTLEVTTLSGNIHKILENQAPTGKPVSLGFKKPDAMLEIINGQDDKVKGDIYVLAYSRIDFDQDTVNFVANDLTEGDKAVYQLHLDSVKASLEARAAFINMLAGIFGK